MLSVHGQVVGIDTHRVGDGFYLARTTDAALQARITELVGGASPRRRTLGVAIAPPSVAAELRRAVGLAARPGLLVRGVVEGGPAARAGVLVGDLLVRAGRRTISATSRRCTMRSARPARRWRSTSSAAPTS